MSLVIRVWCMNLFDLWNKSKQATHELVKTPEFYHKQIWWVQFGKNIATEIYGKGDDFLRPAVVLRKVFSDACIVIPLTSQKKTGSYYFEFDYKNEKQYAALHQVRYIDARRLKRFFGNMKKADFVELQQCFTTFITKK